MRPEAKKGAKGQKADNDKGKGKDRKGGKGQGRGKSKGKGKGKGKGKAYDYYDQPYDQYYANQDSYNNNSNNTWRTLASHEAGLQRLDATASLVLWVPSFVHEDIEYEAKLWEEARNFPTDEAMAAEVAAEGADGGAAAGGHPWACSKSDARFQKLMEGVSKVLHNAELDNDPSTDDSHLKLRVLDGGEAYAPGAESEECYLSTVKTALL